VPFALRMDPARSTSRKLAERGTMSG
jgi:hypothetical protein